MAYLLLKLKGPMQSWGSRSKFMSRDTEKEPTLSGVVGLCCAALGWDRNTDLSIFDAVKMHVRVDREGVVKNDYQTASNVITADQKSHDNLVSNRMHLQDAAFLVCLDGDASLLSAIYSAVKNPVWPLSLGRKSYIPSEPVFFQDGIISEQSSVDEIFASVPLIATPRNTMIRVVKDVPDFINSSHRKDRPVCFSTKQYKDRYVRISYIDATTLKGGDQCI